MLNSHHRQLDRFYIQTETFRTFILTVYISASYDNFIQVNQAFFLKARTHLILTASRLTKSSRQSRTCLTVCLSSVVWGPGGGRFSGCSEDEGPCCCWPSHSAPLWPGEENRRLGSNLNSKDWKVNNEMSVSYLCCLCAPSACWRSCQVRTEEERNRGGLETKQKEYKYWS